MRAAAITGRTPGDLILFGVTAVELALLVRLTPGFSLVDWVYVLQHLLGYLRKQVDDVNRADLVDVIDDYRRGLVPLVVPVTLLQHHFRRNPNPYISRQVYLNPHPRELMLRNVL